MKTTISILIPVRDEQDALPVLFDQLDEILAKLVENYIFSVIVLDDGSIDDTVTVVNSYNSRSFELSLCSLTRNFGKEAAISAGLDRAAGEAIIVMDGDLQHPPCLIPEMLEYWEKGYKVIEAEKADRGKESFVYRFLSWSFYHSLKSATALELENQCDYKLLDMEVVQILRKLPEKNRFFRGLVNWMGFPTHRIAFDVPTREHGGSSWSSLQLLRYSISSIASFSSAPLQIVTMIGLLMLLLSLVLGSVTLIQWLSGSAVTGFTTVIILLLIIGSLLMVSLGVIGLYLSKIYTEIKGRPVYIVKEVPENTANPAARLESNSATNASDLDK